MGAMKHKNNHRGDSLAKKIARFEFYIRLRAWFGEERFRRLTFCYLASFEGGDAAVLTSLGVPLESQLAVDFDAEALGLFADKYPGVKTHLGPIQNITGMEFDCVFVDLCSSLSGDSVDTIKQSTRLISKPGSVFAFAIQRAREWRGWEAKIEKTWVHSKNYTVDPT